MIACGYCHNPLFCPNAWGIVCAVCNSSYGWGVNPQPMPSWYHSDPTGPKPQDAAPAKP